MYERLKELCSARGLNITQLCIDVTHSGGNLSTWKKGYMRSDYLSLVADKLQCSTDYLLGRTDTPTGTYSISNSQTTINGTQANVIHNAMGSDGLTDEFMKVFAELCFDDKVSVMQYVKDIKKAPSKDGGKE